MDRAPGARSSARARRFARHVESLARPQAHNQADSLCDLGRLQGFNTEVTEVLRALRVEALRATEYAKPRHNDVPRLNGSSGDFTSPQAHGTNPVPWLPTAFRGHQSPIRRHQSLIVNPRRRAYRDLGV